MTKLGRQRSVIVAVALAGSAVGCAPEPSPPIDVSSAPSPQQLAISRDEAISIAREAAAAVHSWLGEAPVDIVRQDPFAAVRDGYAPLVSPDPPDDLPVWTIRLFEESSGQGATVVVDAVDGRVLQVVTFIT
jgi:hypothetical protein